MKNSRYRISAIRVPVSEEDLTQYIRLRLLALQTNPEAFGSTFSGESANTRAQWRARIDTKERFTIVARLVTEDGSAGTEEEWVGTASIITPEMATGHTGDLGTSPHVLVGMWLHPEHRRKGLGKQLIGVGKEWIRTQTEGMPEAKKRIALEVHRSNVAAKALYNGLGFLELES
ncbi:acyl-CoA N-acyltransferase [Mycena crocata]|nr:acyl-CoA N-acyltransferase [Mycena crocata]